MNVLEVVIRNKIATGSRDFIVCNNSDYVIKFDFDSEWDGHTLKTARFIFNGSFVDVIFEGNTVSVPIISKSTTVSVGVFAGDLQTTTPAIFPCYKSILCDEGLPKQEDDPNVYAQILESLENKVDKDEASTKLTEVKEYIDKSSNALKAEIDELTDGSLHIGSNINGDYKGFSITAITKILGSDGSFTGSYKISLKDSDDVSKLSVGDKILISTSTDVCPITDIVENEDFGGTVTYNSNDIRVYLPNIPNLALVDGTDTGFKVYNFIVNLSNPSIGDKQVSYNTFTMGNNTKAIERGASAFGENTIAYGSNSFAGGKGSTATDVALAWGLETNALNAGSVSFGQGNNSKGVCSLTAGQGNVTKADNAIAVGYQNTTNAKNGFTIGKNNINNSENSLTVGYNLKLSEDNIHYDSDDVFVAGYNEPFLRVKKDGKTYIKNAEIESTNTIKANTLMAKNVVSTKTLHVGTGDSHFEGTLKVDKLIDGSNRTYSPVYYWNFKYETVERSSTKSYDLGNNQSYTVTNDEKYSSQVITKITDTQDALILPDHVTNKFHTNPNDLIVGIIKNTSEQGHSYSYVHLPNKLKFLGKNAFDYGYFEKIDLPNTLTHIGSSCFYTSRLLEINLPDSVEYVGSHAFYSCTRLRKVKWSSKCVTIPDFCFYGCTSLEEIEIPFGITTINTYAFVNCSNLKRIVLPTTVSNINDTAFDNISSDAVFYVGYGSYAEQWCIDNGKNYELTESKNYTDTKIRETTIRLWQPNTEYKVGDAVFTKEGQILQAYYCEVDHTSGSSFSTGEGFRSMGYEYAGSAEVAGRAYDDGNGNDIVSTYATKEELSSYSQKPTIITDNTSTTYDVEFLGSTNKIIRLTSALSELNLTFNDGEYNADLIVNVVFNSGDTATQISYPNTGIINWIGTDCALSGGKSIFAPSANMRYDIVFSFDGSQLVGYVCGYTPATVSNG